MLQSTYQQLAVQMSVYEETYIWSQQKYNNWKDWNYVGLQWNFLSDLSDRLLRRADAQWRRDNAPDLKIADWAGYLEELGIGSIILNPIFESDNHAMTQEILRRSTVASERTKISKQYVKRFIRTISRSCSTGYSITSAEVFGHFRMC